MNGKSVENLKPDLNIPILKEFGDSVPDFSKLYSKNREVLPRISI